MKKPRDEDLFSLTRRQLIGRIRLSGAVPWTTMKKPEVPGGTRNILLSCEGKLNEEHLSGTKVNRTKGMRADSKDSGFAA